MSRVPFFSWSALVAAIGLLLVLPVLVGVLIYLYVDHRYGQALFGGTDGVASWIGFALTQPATYLFALPAAGIAAELVPVTFRTRMPMRGAVYTGLGLIGVAALSAVTQQATHDVPWAGSGLDLDGFGDKFADLLPYAFFTLLPILGVLIVMAGRRARRQADRRPPAAPDHGAVRVLRSSAWPWCSPGCSAGRWSPSSTSGCKARSSRKAPSCTSSTAPCWRVSARWRTGARS